MRDLLSLGNRYWRTHRALFLILGFTFILYLPSVGNGFVNLDDPSLVTENPIVTSPSRHSLVAAFTSYDPELYIPATFLSYQTEAWTLGMRSWHFHFFSLLLHLGCVLLVYSVAKKLTASERVAVLAALLAAVHPINSEAVLWVSGRKDLLFAFFFLLSWRLWLEGSRTYGASVAAFAASLFAKISAAMLPPVLLLSLWHQGSPIGKREWKRLAPFVLLAAAFAVIAVFGKTEILRHERAATFVVMAFRSAAFYLQIIAVPANLSVVHAIIGEPHAVSVLLSAFSIAVFALISLVGWLKRDTMRIIATGWLFYLVTLAPTFLHYTHGNGEIIVGSERYAYVPSIGIFLIAASAAVWLYENPKVTRPTRIALLCAAAVLALAYAKIDLQRIAVFKNSITFNDDIIEHTFGFAKAHYNLGAALEADRQPQNADDEYALAMELDPLYADAAINRGILYAKEGRMLDAEAMFRKAIDMRPDYFKGHYDLAALDLKLGRFADAAKELEKTVALFPDYPQARLDLATAYGKLNRFADALEQFRILSELDPGFRQRAEEALKQAKK